MRNHAIFKLFPILLLFISIFNVNGQTTIQYQGLDIEFTHVENVNTCKEETLLVEVINTNSSTYNDLELTFVSSNNVGVEDSKVFFNFSSVTQSGLTVEATNNKIKVDEIDPGSGNSVSFLLPYNANCSNFVSSPTSITSNIKIGVSDGITPYASPVLLLLNIGFGYLIQDQSSYVNNYSFSGYNGSIFQRTYRIKNSSTTTDFNGVLLFEEDVASVIAVDGIRVIVRNNSTIISNNYISSLSFVASSIDPEISGKITQPIPLSDVPPGAIIELIEDVNITGCPNSTKGKVSLSFGCNNTYCKPVLQNLILTIGQGPDIPLLSFQTSGGDNTELCLPSNSGHKTITIKNNGRDARELKIQLYQPQEDMTGNIMKFILLSSVQASYSPGSTPSTITVLDEQSTDYSDHQTVTSYSNCSITGDPEMLQSKTIKFDLLKTGDEVVIEFDQIVCCPDTGLESNVIPSLLVKSYYMGECGADVAPSTFTYYSKFYTTPVTSFQTLGNNNMFGCNVCNTPSCFGSADCDPSTLNDPNSATDYTQPISIKHSSFNFGGNNSPLLGNSVVVVVDLAADGNLMLAPQEYAGATAEAGNIRFVNSIGTVFLPDVQTSYTNISDITGLFGSNLNMPSTADGYMGARAVFEIDLTEIDVYSRYKKVIDFINSLELRFELSAKCDRVSTGNSRYYERIYLGLDPECEECLLPIGEYSKGIIINCPGCIFPGVITGEVFMERITFGLNDSNNDGIPDDGNNDGIPDDITADNSNVRKNMVTDEDIFFVRSDSRFWEGSLRSYGKGSANGTLETQANFTPRFLNNLCRHDKFTGKNISPDIFEVEISTQHPLTVHYSRGVFTDDVSFTSNTGNLVTTDGAGNFLIQIPVQAFRTQFNNAGFNFEAEDIFQIEVFYKVKKNAFDLPQGEYYSSVDVATRVFLTGGTKDVNEANEAHSDSPFGGIITANPSDLTTTMNYICEGNGATFVLADIKEKFYFGRDPYTFFQRQNPTFCDNSYAGGFSINSSSPNDYTRSKGALFDLFPFEVRNFNKAFEYSFIVPKGFVFDSYDIFNFSSFRGEDDFSYRNGYSFKRGLTSVKRIVIDYADEETNIVLGDLVTIEFSNNYSLFYDTRGGDVISQNGFELNATDRFNDYNEYMEQVFTINLKPDCASEDLELSRNPQRSIRIANKPLDASATIQSSDNTTRQITTGPFVTVSSIQNRLQYFNIDQSNPGFTPDEVTTTDEPSSGFNVAQFDPYWSEPSQQLTLSTQNNIYLSRRNQKVTFTIQNTHGRAFENVFMYLVSASNQITFSNVKIIPSSGPAIPISVVNGVYRLGTKVASGASLVIEAEVNYDCSSSALSSSNFTVYYGYGCTSYPTSDGNGVLTPNPCYMKNTNVSLHINDTEADNLEYSITEGAIACDNKLHCLKIKSIGNGSIYSNSVEIVLPAGMYYELGSTVIGVRNGPVNFVQGLSLASFPDPVKSVNSSNHDVLTWDLSHWSGWGSFDFTDPYIVELQYQTSTSCAYNLGTIAIEVDQESYCGERIDKILSYSIPSPSLSCSGTPITFNISAPNNAAPLLCEQSGGGTGIPISASVNSTSLNYVWEYKSYESNATYSVISGANTYQYLATYPGLYRLSVTGGCGNLSDEIPITSDIDVDCPDPICPGEYPELILRNSDTGELVEGLFEAQWYDTKGTLSSDSDDEIVTGGIAQQGHYYAKAIAQLGAVACTLSTINNPCLIQLKNAPPAYQINIEGYPINHLVICPARDMVNLVIDPPISTPPNTTIGWNADGPQGAVTWRDVSREGDYYLTAIDNTTGCITKSNLIHLDAPEISIEPYCVNGNYTLHAYTNFTAGTINWHYVTTEGAIANAYETGSSVSVTNPDRLYTASTTYNGCPVGDGFYLPDPLPSSVASPATNLTPQLSFAGIGNTCPATNLFDNDPSIGCLTTVPSSNIDLIGKYMISSNAEANGAASWNPGFWTGLGHNVVPGVGGNNPTNNEFMIVDGKSSVTDQVLFKKTFTTPEVQHGYRYYCRAHIRNIVTADQNNITEIPQVFMKVIYRDAQGRVEGLLGWNKGQVLSSTINGTSPWIEFGIFDVADVKDDNQNSWFGIAEQLEMSILMEGGGAIGRDIAIDDVEIYKVGLCDQLDQVVDATPCSGISLAHSNLLVCPSGSVNLTINKPNTQAVTYTLFTNGSSQVIGTTSDAQTIASITPTVTPLQSYTVVVTGTGCTTTHPFTVRTDVPPVLSIRMDANSNACDNTHFTALLNGSENTTETYIWSLNGSPVALQTGYQYTASAALSSNDIVTCQIASLSWCSSTQSPSDDLTITGAGFTANAGTDQFVCAGSSASLGLTSVSGLSYEWREASTSIPNPNPVFSTSSQVNVNPSVNTTYELTGMNSSGCISTDEITVTVNQIQNISVSEDITVCSGSATTLNVGYAVSLDGMTGYIAVPDDPSLNPVSAISIGGWVKTEANNMYIATKSDNSFYLAIGPAGTTANKASFYLNGVGGWLQGSTDVNDGEWHHIMGIYNGSVIAVYVDGVLESSASVTGNITTGNSPVYLGGRGSSTLTVCTLDEIGIWNVGLTQTEVNEIMNNSIVPGGAGQIAFWRMEEGTGTTVSDISGNGNNGILNSGTNWVRPSAPLNYLWSPVTGLSTITGSEVVATPSTTMTYTVSIENGCIGTDEVEVTVSMPPDASDAGSDQTVCAATATLAGNTATTGTGSWSVASGIATITTPSSPTSGVTDLVVGSTTLRWTISNSPCTASIDDIMITRANSCKLGEFESEDEFLLSDIELKVQTDPNPFTDQTMVTITGTTSEYIKIVLIDINGKVVFENDHFPVNESVAVGEKLSAGMYLLKVIDGEKTLSEKLLKFK